MSSGDRKYAETFALFVEHKEILTFLKPFLDGIYDVGVEIRTSAPSHQEPYGRKFFWCSIKRVFPERGIGTWEAIGTGSTILEAVHTAVVHAWSNVKGEGQQ